MINKETLIEKAHTFWAINSCNYDTYAVRNSVDNFTKFETDDLGRFMADFVIEILNDSENEGWISVDDDLPKVASFVNAYKTNGLVLGLYYNANKEFMYGEINQTSQVTHWRKLPDKPKQS